MSGFKYDEIGYWSEVKLQILKEYAGAYSLILNKRSSIRKHIYIDGFAGAGRHISRVTGEFVPGSPLNALAVTPPFTEYHLVDLNGGKAAELRQLVGNRKGVFIYEGDAHKCLLEQIFPRCRYEDYCRALCLLDPYGLNVEWRVLRTAGKMQSVEVFYNFMIMDANMNVLWRNPDKVTPSQAERMDRVWGDRSWRDVAYRTVPTLFGDVEEKAANEDVAEAFRNHLRRDAGFRFVPRPMPMRNRKGAVVYYLFFASPNANGAKIVGDIFDKYRTRGMG